MRQKLITILKLFLLLFVVALVWGGWYVNHKGFNRHWRQFVNSEFEKRGLSVAISRLTLDPFHGLVARDVEIYDVKSHHRTLAVISQIVLDINYSNLFHHKPFLNGQEEAAAKYGDDPRVYLTTSTKFEGDEHGHVKAVHTVEVQWEKNDKGQFIPKNVPGSEKVVPAQLVLLAMGFLGPEQPLLEALGVDRDARTNIKAEHEKYITNIPGVFAAGDCRRGQSLVVWAFNEGRGAARECDRWLMGSTDLP